VRVPFDPLSDPHILRGSDAPSPRPNLFRSAKAEHAIPFARRWHADGLRALALDAKVHHLAAYHGAEPLPQEVETCVVAIMADGEVAVGFAREQPPTPSFLLGAMPLVILTRSDVEREPRFTTVREIWSTARTPIDPADRI
jgi:hypothetical protein